MNVKIFQLQTFFNLVVPSSLFLALPLFAKNDLLVKGFNNITNGRICGYVTEREYKKIDVSCKYPYSKDLYLNLATTNEDVFEWSVFQEAAKLQKQKNQCLIKVLNDLQNDQTVFQKWSDRILYAWLSRRQIQLAIKFCEDSNNKKSQSWKDLCANDQNISTLRLAEEAINSSTPLVGGPEILDALDGVGGEALISKKSGKKYTDDEFLELDFDSEELYDIVALNEEASRDINRILKNRLRYFSYERENENSELNKKFDNQNKVYELDSETKDSLFEDNTVYQTLENLNLLGANSNQPSMGASCLLNHYESSVTSEVLSWMLTSATGSLAFLKLGVLARLSSMKKAQKMPANIKSPSKLLYRNNKLLGAITASSTQGLNESIASCDSNDKEKVVRKSQLLNKSGDKNLSESEFSYNTPSECKSLPKNSALFNFERSSCIQNLLKHLLYILPLKSPLPKKPILNK